MTKKATMPRPGRLRALLNGVFDLLLTRSEIMALEVQEAKDEILAQCFAGLLALVFLGLGLFVIILLLWTVVPAVQRPWVLGILAIALLLSGIVILWRLRQTLQQQRPWFSSSITELRKDWQVLSGGKEE